MDYELIERMYGSYGALQVTFPHHINNMQPQPTTERDANALSLFRMAWYDTVKPKPSVS